MQIGFPVFILAAAFVLGTVSSQGTGPQPPVLNCGRSGAPWEPSWATYWECFNKHMKATSEFCRQYGQVKVDGSCTYNSNGNVISTSANGSGSGVSVSGQNNIINVS